MLAPEEIAAIALRLHRAGNTRQQVRAPSLDHPGITIADAYAVQREGIRLKLAEGRTVKEGSAIPIERFIVPMVEVELAFILKHELKGEQVSVFDVLSATDYVTPAIEIIDARCHRVDPETKRPRRVMDTISDNAANAGLVLGGRAVRPMDVDLRWVAALLYRNGVIEETGVAAGVLNHPAHGIAWLARKFAPHGVALEAGQVILSGSFTRPVAAGAGDTFHADYGPLGNIAFRFV